MDLITVDPPFERGPGAPDRRPDLPPGAVITLITRGRVMVASTRLQGWDQVTVLAHVKDEEAIRAALSGKKGAEAPGPRR